MKKVLFLLSVIFLVPLGVAGRERTQTELDSIARLVATSFTHQTRSSQSEATADRLISDATCSAAVNRQIRKVLPGVDNDYFAVYVSETGNAGYAIISTDDRMPALIAFSDSQHFDTDRIPTAMQYMLAYFVKNMDEYEEAPVGRATADLPSEVNPLLGDIAFNQFSPYNDKCPLLNGDRTATGCLATAMAQIMAYYKHPAQMYGDKIEYVTATYGIPVSWDCTKTKFDWANILDTYSSASTTDYHANESTTEMQYLQFSDISLSDRNTLEISNLCNAVSETISGDLQLLVCDQNRHLIQPIGQRCKITNLLRGYGWGSYFIEHAIPSDFQDGNYRIYLGFKSKNSSVWSLMQRVKDSQSSEFYLSLSKEGAYYKIGDKSFPCCQSKIQGEAVATLLAACGAATYMDYGPESPTENKNIGLALINNMGYDDGLYFFDSWVSPSKAWMEHFIQTELQQKRPVYCNGATENYEGHAFVLDGYRYMGETPYFHINWGWNGSENGYFLIDAMTANSKNFAVSYNLTLGIKPDDGKDDGVLFVIKKVSASVNNLKISLTLENFSNRTLKPFTGDFIYYAVDETGKEYALGMMHYDEWPSFAGFGTFDLTLDIPSGLSTGNYTIILKAKENGATVEKTILTPLSFPVVRIEADPNTINDATATMQNSVDAYSLTGHKVSTSDKSAEELPKGIYIINGKKSLIRR